jgi:hypothetical protein
MCIYIMYIYNVYIYTLYIYMCVYHYIILCIILYANHTVRSASEVVATKKHTVRT